MKYIIVNNQEWNYDDLESQEFLLLSMPDSITINSDLISRYLDERNIKYEFTKYGGWNILNDKGKFKYNTWISRFFEFDDDERKDLLKWLEQFGVCSLPFEMLDME